MNYSINKIFNQDECFKIIDFSEKTGVPYLKNKRQTWDCKRIYDENFKASILDKIYFLYSKNEIKFWFDYSDFDLVNTNVTLTKYYDGRFLGLHKDNTSSYTTVVVLNNNFNGGEFCLSNKICDIDKSEIKIHLNSGEAITFEGNKTLHGVMPVNVGTRFALNIWMNDNPVFKYDDVLDNKKLI